jgi:thymidylate kinase
MCKSIRLDIPLEIMEERIRERGPMNEYDLQRRRANAVVERAYAKENCDYIIDATQPKEKVLADVIKILF